MQLFLFTASEAAAESGGSGGFGALFEALGLNLQALVLNSLAFLALVWLLGRFVYPHLIKALDRKKGELEAATRLEQEARTALDKADKKAEELLSEARTSAEEIISAAHADAMEQQEAARAKAAAQAERIVAEAREQLARDLQAARKELKTDAAKLVAAATESLLNEKLDGERDAALIGRSLEVK